MFPKLLKGLEEQISSGLLMSRLNYHNSNPWVKKLLVSSFPPLPPPTLTLIGLYLCSWWLDTGIWNPAIEVITTYLASQNSHEDISLAECVLHPEPQLLWNLEMKFLSSTRTGWEWKLLPIASAWETGWLTSPGHPKVFRNKTFRNK